MTMNDLTNNTYRADIMIVDDTPDNLQVLFTMLNEHGYEVRRVLNGQQAITAIATEPPDLILLDIMMPELNGYEVCIKLKSKENTSHIPVIFLSALDEAVDRVRGFEVGGADYITKPFHIQEVIARVENQLTIIRQRKQLLQQNENLQKLNIELSRSNQELEEFAHVVSHELLQPLTTIKALSQLLLFKYCKEFNEEMQQFLNQIVAATDRMHQLTRKLLAYAQVGSQDLHLCATDCQGLLEELLIDLQMNMQDTDHQIVILDKLPVIMADQLQLRELFQNLITNALKYHREIPLLIQIKAIALPSHWLFSITDNGMGIATEHIEKIFTIFTRTPSVQELPGSGIGLSICQKIVERHGGKIWLESKVGEGTTFYFTFPLS
jgi:light-regulated signal transduction histidine kinase (bacteriophytochrome)